jgi:AraC family transcriptional regulator
MKTPLNHQIECSSLPILSSKDRDWENIVVEQFQHPPGEGQTYYSDQHTICMSLAPRPVRFLQIKGGRTHEGLYGKGDISITPAKMSFFARWNSDDRYMQIRITSKFIKSVARDALEMNPEQVQFIPEFRTRDSQIEAMGMMLLAELQQENLGGRLYIDSLTNVLAVRLLRQYSAFQPHLSMYEGGLPARQLVIVLDYINEYLDRDIRLADLAQLVGMSQFHFSYLFKRSLGKPPYQYLLQQRIERAKQLLKQTDISIVNIAFTCGFSSHSHLSKQFRQLTGVTPKAFRATC